MSDAIPLAEHEVHVWSRACAADPGVDLSTWNLLSSDERAAADRLRDDGDRALRVLARATLRQLLGRYAGTHPKSLRFERATHGKPQLVQPGHPRLRFNVAHSGAQILVAVTTERELGVDVERIQPEFPWEEVASSLLSSVEITTIRGLPPGRRVQTFFDCWVRKEAYLKGLGTGLTAPLGDFVVPLGPSGGAVRDDRRSSSAEPVWRVHPLDVGRGYAAALAIAGDAQIVARRWDSELADAKSTRQVEDHAADPDGWHALDHAKAIQLSATSTMVSASRVTTPRATSRYRF